MYPFGDLPGNLAAFCGVLRRQHGFRLGPGEINDAARVLQQIDVTDQQHVRHAWRAILSGSRDTALAFDAAFDAFFFPGRTGRPQEGMPAMPPRAEPSPSEKARAERPAGDGDTDESPDTDAGSDAASDATSADDDAADEPETRLQRARYSPLDVEGSEPVELRPVSPPWRESARSLVRRLQVGLSRRWRPSPRGRRFDLRRTWRTSVQTGGEAVMARWLRRVHRSPRVVILIDGSRSMRGSEQPALDLAVALASVTRRVEVFVFSTTLASLTRQVRRAGAGRVARLALDRTAWGGGTSIGASLRTFLHLHGERHVTRETLVLIVSDGLDVGSPDLLRDAMREIRRRAAGVTWLNPLLDTPGYEPSSRGMAAARPFITTFSSVSDAVELARLARIVRLRR
jgi:uncharacterized protein with von Willebrand factor type A (vWA) domain